LIIPLISFCLCLPLLAVSLLASRKMRLVDKPGVLKIHAKPVPVVGGVAILFSMSVAVLITQIVRGQEYYVAEEFLAFFGGGACLCAIGLWDDVRPASPFSRLFLEVLVAGIVVKAGYSIKMTQNDWIWYLFSILFLTGLINAVNMLDGMDGLAGGVSLLSSAGFGYLFYRAGLWTPLLMSLALTGSLAAFLTFNFHPAKIFLGDNGSYLLGFTAFLFSAVLAPQSLKIGGLTGIILVIGLPVIEAAMTIVRRLWRGRSPLAGDRSHLYDLLFQWTGSQVKTVLMCYAIQVALIITGILLIR
jgi:UDP-GlcNAc:undecaprenyl-phosphate GlcNAc-1-phosphate transferase